MKRKCWCKNTNLNQSGEWSTNIWESILSWMILNSTFWYITLQTPLEPQICGMPFVFHSCSPSEVLRMVLICHVFTCLKRHMFLVDMGLITSWLMRYYTNFQIQNDNILENDVIGLHYIPCTYIRSTHNVYYITYASRKVYSSGAHTLYKYLYSLWCIPHCF